MSPPIRDGSGNSIGSIRLGDGSEIAEVRTGAGDVLFSASAIPDSLVTRIDGTSITTTTSPNRVDDVVDSNPFDINAGSVGSLGGRDDMLIPDDDTTTQAFALPASRAGDNINLNGSDWSIIAVVYFDGTVGEMTGDGGVDGSGYSAITQLSQENFEGLWVDGEDNNSVTWYDGGVSSSEDVVQTGSVTADTFHLAAVTYDESASTLTVYLDDPLGSGSKSSTTYDSFNEDWTAEGITIGSRIDGNRPPNGGVDVVEYYNVSLSDQEISDSYSRLI